MPLLIFFYVPQNVFSQLAYNFFNYTQENGIASSTLTGITKDSTGFLWLWSENGLTRFDGYTFKIFRNNPGDSGSISSPYIIDIKIDSEKNIYIRTSNSISRYDEQNNSFKKIISFSNISYFLNWVPGITNSWVLLKGHLAKLNHKTNTYTQYAIPPKFLPGNFYQAIETEKNIFIDGYKEILLFDKNTKKFSEIPFVSELNTNSKPKTELIAFFKNKKGEIGFYSSQGFFIYDTSKNVFNKMAQSTFRQDNTFDLSGKLVTPTGILCVAKRNGYLYCVNMKTGLEKVIDIKKFCVQHLKKDFAITQIFNSGNSSVWISTFSSGIFKYNTETNTAQQYFHKTENSESITSNGSNYIYDDNSGVVWVSLPGIGLAKGEQANPLFRSFSPQAGNDAPVASTKNNIRCVLEYDKENILALTLNGGFLFNRPKKLFNNITHPDSHKPLLSLGALSDAAYDRDSNLWIASWSGVGLYVLNVKLKKSFKIKTPDIPSVKQNFSIRCLYSDSRNNLWIGTADNAILRFKISDVDFNNGTVSKFDVFNSTQLRNESLQFNITFCITESKNGEILFGTQNGMYVYNYSTNAFVKFTEHSSHKSMLSNDDVRSIYTDSKNTLWVGTNGGGLNRYNDSTKTFTVFKTENGLPDNIIYSILEDNNGLLWLGTNKGLCRFDKEKLICKNYSPKDGIQNYEFNTNAACKASNGELIFGGVNGFNIFNPDSINTVAYPPKIIITQFKVGDKEKNILSEEIKLRHDENYISFEFSELNYFRNNENQFAYKLDGLNTDWIYCGTRRFTNYANLSPGTYTFRVKAANCYGEWSEAEHTLKINLATPWYKTSIFRFALMLVVSAIVYIIFRIRLNQKLKLQDVRNKIARDLHDEIGSNLSSISLFTEVAKEKVTDEKSTLDLLLKKISEYTQSSQEAMNDIVWMINARNDSFENIIVRMRALAAEMFEAKNINLHLNFDEKLNHYKMGMDERKNFYLIYKEAVNNIVKYAGCQNVWIDLWQLHSSIYLRIKDDGKGFDTTKKYTGNGLNNIYKRTENLKGHINIQSNTGVGTLLELQFAI